MIEIYTTIDQQNLSAVIKQAGKLAGSKTERTVPALAAIGSRHATRPKFTVINGGIGRDFKRADTLEKELMFFRNGSKCRIFRNAGKGATIDFD